MKTLKLLWLTLAALCLTECSKPAAPVAPPVSRTVQQQAWQEINAGALVIDVRSAEEFASGHLPEARNIPHDQIENRIFEIMSAKDRSVVLYCRSGRRSGIAKDALERIGFTKVLNAGGYEDLKAAKPLS